MMPSPSTITVTSPYGSSTFSFPSDASAFITSMSPTFGPPGTIVEILGLNLDQVTGIFFGTVEVVNFTLVDDSTITVPAPIPKTVFESDFVVTVQTASIGGFSISPQTFTYTEFTTWNPVTVVGVSLAAVNGFPNLQVSGSSTSETSGVQAFAPQFSGKYYFEITVNVTPSGSSGGFAIGTAGSSYISLTAENGLKSSAGALCQTVTSAIFAPGNKDELTNIAAFGLTAGDTVGVAVDIDEGLVWFKVVDGPDVNYTTDWNGGAIGSGGVYAGSNPVGAVLGIPLPDTPLLPFALVNVSSGTMVMTANFGQNPFLIIKNTGSKPVGFTFWPSA